MFHDEFGQMPWPRSNGKSPCRLADGRAPLIGDRLFRGALDALCRYANAVGALTTCQRGAIPALPTRQDVERFMVGKETP